MSAPLTRREIAAAFGRAKVIFVLPAAPGYFVLALRRDEQGEICAASQTPVIGWALDELHHTSAITPQEMTDDDAAILAPDGQVMAFGRTWANVADWLDEHRAIRARKGQQ